MTKVDVRRFEPHHFDMLSKFREDIDMERYVNEGHLKALADSKYAYSIFVDDRLIACAGVVEYWHNRGEAWAIVGREASPHMRRLSGIVTRFLDTLPIKRVEACVDVGFVAGHRWIRLLGFKMEAPLLKSFRPSGKDASLYARIKP